MARQVNELADVSRELSRLDSMPTADQTTGLALAGGMAMQTVRTSYATAMTVQKPRSLMDVQRRLIEEATLAGEDFYYGWGAGKDAIEGPSIDLAVAAARCWGNCATEMLPMQETADAWIFTAVFIDLETGYTRSRQFRQSKSWNVHGKMDKERKDDMRFQIGQSKAERNVILKALPASIIARAMEAAKSGVRARVEAYIAEKGFPAAIDLLLRALAKTGVTEAAVVEKMGVANKSGLDVSHLVTMRGDLNAIEKGQARFDELYPRTKTDEVLDKLKGADKGKPVASNGDGAKPASPEQMERIGIMAEGLATQEAIAEHCREIGADPVRLSEAQAGDVIRWLEKLEPAGSEG